MLNECILNLKAHKKIVCSICSDNFSANKSACENLVIPIHRQYCNCHCASLSLFNLFSIGKPYYKITVQIKLALRLLKDFKPPFLSNIKWKSMSESLEFIVENISNLNKIIDIKLQKQNSKKKDQYIKLKKVKCDIIKNAVSEVTSFIIQMENDDMKIECVHLKLFTTICKLYLQNTKISREILKEIIHVYVKNINLIIPLSAFLLTSKGSSFWLSCENTLKDILMGAGWIGITYFCFSSNIEYNDEMHDCYVQHLENGSKIECDPFIYWYNSKNALSDVACRILSIPCSESSVERLFGGLSFMLDPTSNRMKDDLIDAELNIRMSSLFEHRDSFEGSIKEQLEKCNEFLMKSFP